MLYIGDKMSLEETIMEDFILDRKIITKIPDKNKYKEILKLEKVILSPLGEVTHEIRTDGDCIKFKIKYVNISNEKLEFYIVDSLDYALSEIEVENGGRYVRQRHAVFWKIEGLLPKQEGSVEFSATVKEKELIVNEADGYIEREIVAVSNKVELSVVKKPKLGWIPLIKNSNPGETTSSNMKDETTMGITINFDISGMNIHKTLVDGIQYHQISIPGHASHHNVGKPEFPIVGQMIEIPFGVELVPEIVKTQSIDLMEYNIFPTQEPVPRSEIKSPNYMEKIRKRKFEIDTASYLTDVAYPKQLCSIQAKDIGVIRGHRVALIQVNPIQYNPTTRKMVAYSKIEVRLNYNHPAQINRVNLSKESPAFESLLERTLLNYKKPNRFPRGSPARKEDTGCDYLILTHPDFYVSNDANNPLIRLKNWKQRKGLKTGIVDVTTIPGGNTANSITAYIQDVYDTWNPIPTYILLVGDADFIPTSYGTNHSEHNNTAIGSDLYYTTVDGSPDDYFPDIYIGRLSVETLQQTTDVVEKILNYEQNPPATPANANFYTDISLVCLFEDDGTGTAAIDGREDTTFRIIENAESVRTYLLNQGYNVERIYDQSGNFVQGPLRYENGTNIPVDLTIAGNPPAIPGFPWTGGTADISNAINAGNFIVAYNGHGDRREWNRPNFDTGDISALTNGNNRVTPVVFSFACMTGWFDDETDANNAYYGGNANNDCLCELFLREANHGAVAVIGSSRISWDNNDFMFIGAFKALWPDFVPNPPVSGTVPQMQMGPLMKLGQVNTFSKIYMAKRYSDDWLRESSFEMYHLFGDPDMSVWTQAPSILEVKHPVGIGSLGEQDFIIEVLDKGTQVPIQGATVTLTQSRAGQIVNIIRGSKQTNPDGICRFTLQGIPSDELDLTVTAQNYRMHSATIEVSANGGVINRLDPDNGIEDQVIHVGGQGFQGTENVEIYFGDQLVQTVAAINGEFGQIGNDVNISVPNPHELGPVNVYVYGQTSKRHAVDVFYVRSKNPIDLFTYSQSDETTWHLTPGSDPNWNSPDIKLYEGANEVASNNLVVGTQYKVKLKVRNETSFQADSVSIVYKWRNYGIGGPWTEFYTDTRDVPGNSVIESEAPFTPAATGHLCMRCEIYHIEDINLLNNNGQENLHVGPTSSPTKVCFQITNTSKYFSAFYLEVRQLEDPKKSPHPPLWGTWVKHPEKQILSPGKRAEACVTIDPDVAKDVKIGDKAEFSVTGFLNGEMIGGVNIRLVKTGVKEYKVNKNKSQ